MPEGHTIHRLARDHVRDLAREPLAVSSPQGRAVETARALDGRSFAKIDAYGKHLLYRFEDDLTLHVHLGLFGRFRRQHTPPEEPKGEKRLRMIGERWTVDLSGAVACALIDPDEEAALLSRLGPDPLRRDADPERFVAALRKRRIPIGAAIMDQKVVAGIGNVFRAEALHVDGIDPRLPARELGDERAMVLWGTMAKMLADGVRERRIVTIRDADDKPVKAGRATKGEGPRARADRVRHRTVHVYRREHCHDCDAPVVTSTMAGRTVYECPVCQPEGSAGPSPTPSLAEGEAAGRLF
ncbi:Fpg/Nei family DNA glycosylase [Patulibacter sp.]|uniref:Fpg/Nei family DNA glycosylase n=1 Tax=Patulibacter sp. TaxID=1912859 RepID=UPI002725FE9E|nr:DNA-formamidopyrimidine glycosylase family protein [Patulibacter sp.]MDO9408269.1 DNA-formamidopyrimidine glycosylase family protein [Patulibacter sp.]